jgi:hypothetical protein
MTAAALTAKCRMSAPSMTTNNQRVRIVAVDNLSKTASQILGWVAIFALFFIFWGTPDLWDKWHAEAMGTTCTVMGKEAGK